MKVEETSIRDVIVLTSEPKFDERGSFKETYVRKWFSTLVENWNVDFCQDNEIYSEPRVLRGMHCTLGRGSAKLVRVARGIIFDVAVDLRQGPTFGKWVGVELSASNMKQLFLPRGVAHGFMSLGASVVEYKTDAYWGDNVEMGLAWDDPEVGIVWPMRSPVLSEKDKMNPSLATWRLV